MELSERLKTKVQSYKVSQRRLDPIRQAPILLVCGITGAGKNAVLDTLRKEYPDLYHFIVSHTTRSRRDNEVDDVHYHFVDKTAMEQMIDEGDFVEANIVHADDVYGTSIAEIERIESANQIACTDVTIAGVDDYMALDLNAKAVFLLPPSYEIWRKRLLKRFEASGGMTKRDLKNRLESAVSEVQHALDVDYYYIVINNDLHYTAGVVHEIATGVPVEPHYHKAIEIAEEILTAIRAELETL